MHTKTLLITLSTLTACAAPMERQGLAAHSAGDPIVANVEARAAPAPAKGVATASTRTEDIEANLARLRALGVVTIGGLEAGPDSANRLAAFTDAAERAAPATDESVTEGLELLDNIDALRALHIVTVGSLIYDDPDSASQCYGPCPARSEAERERALKLAGIVAATKGL